MVLTENEELTAPDKEKASDIPYDPGFLPRSYKQSFHANPTDSGLIAQIEVLGRNQYDILGIEGFQERSHLFRDLVRNILLLSAAAILGAAFIKIGRQTFLETLETIAFFLGGGTVIVASIGDLGQMSPTIQSIGRRYSKKRPFKKPNLRMGKSLYLTGVVMVLLSFLLTSIRVRFL